MSKNSTVNKLDRIKLMRTVDGQCNTVNNEILTIIKGVGRAYCGCHTKLDSISSGY